MISWIPYKIEIPESLNGTLLFRNYFVNYVREFGWCITQELKSVTENEMAFCALVAMGE